MCKKLNFLNRIFPPKYDFYGMLTKQADLTAQGVQTLSEYFAEPTRDNFKQLLAVADEADTLRMTMEEQLIEAFATPFDRQDLYTFSVRMDRIIEYGKSSVLALRAYKVDVDQVMRALTEHLVIGTSELARGTALLETDPKGAQEGIELMRKAHASVCSDYREAMSGLFAASDAMQALKLREVYRELKEASEYLDLVVDVFHRIVVRVV